MGELRFRVHEPERPAETRASGDALWVAELKSEEQGELIPCGIGGPTQIEQQPDVSGAADGASRQHCGGCAGQSQRSR